jgi:pSer/pThr/pTyr-binding forkhead associated (FHA) protein
MLRDEIEGQNSAAAAARPRLIVAEPGGLCSYVVAAGADLVIGRGPQVAVRVLDPAVAPRHLRLRATSSDFSIEDLGHSSGTWLRDVLIPPLSKVKLGCGETIVIGCCVLAVCLHHPFARPHQDDRLVDAEHARIVEALVACRWNRTRAAARLGLHRLKLLRLMRKYGIPEGER